MFDWNDEELTNIIWGEPTESDDHIVPYQEGTENYCNKKEWSEQSTTVKPTEQKLHEFKADVHERKPVNVSSFNPNEGISTVGFRMDSWSKLSISNKTKINRDSAGAKPSSNLSEITNYSSTCVGRTHVFDKEPVLENLHEGKEQGDLVDYSWANVGSFDDLDRIFSNDEPVFGNVNLPSADELWSSSKDGDSPGKSFNTTDDSTSLELGVSRTRTLNQNAEIKTQCKQQDDLSFDLSYGSMVDPASHIPKSVEYAGNKSKFIAKEQANVKLGVNASATKSRPTAVRVSIPNKVAYKSRMPPYGQRKLLKYQKKADEIAEGKSVHNLHGSWSPSGSPMGLNANQLPFSSSKPSPSSAMCQGTQPQVSDSVPQKHIADAFIGHTTYGNHMNPCQAMPVVSSIQLKEGLPKTSTMTPQEKIEKLRRRQQMQALLAIQKQQQQFSHQVPLANHSLPLSGTQEDKIRRVEGPDIEQAGTLHSFDPTSPYEQDDSNTVCVTIDDSSGEYKVLHRLQDVISKLDVRIRLCIRDSLFRLAQCAIQRHASDKSSTNKGGMEEPEVFVMEETRGHDRVGDTETETNPIDRTVANLLFHWPLEFSVKHPDLPESPASCKLSSGLKAGNLVNPPMQCTSESGLVQQYVTYQGSENLCSIADITSSSPCLDSSDYTSNYAPIAEDGELLKQIWSSLRPTAFKSMGSEH